MSINTAIRVNGPLVLVTQQNGVTVIPQPTPLTRLNYFDGKFLRASDLSAEQLYLRRLVDLSNQAGGPGVAHGFNLSLAASGDTLDLGPGLAVDPQGRVLLLPEAFSIGVEDLIAKSRQLKSSPSTALAKSGSFAECTVVAETPPGGVAQAASLYLITIGFAEALCGTEDVFGKLCEEACATSTDRPYLVEGIIVRVIPLQLQTPLPTSAVVALSQLHLRSRVASAFFEDERNNVANFISGNGLHSDVWCFGADAAGGIDVPIGVLARAGHTTLFLDAWIARRERIDTPAKRYWQWRMAMRPWDVFLAQILQFQCQLSGLFKKQPQAGGGDDPCADVHGVIREASNTVEKLANFYQTVTTRFTLQPLLVFGSASDAPPPVLEGGLAALLAFQNRLQAASTATFVPGDKILIDGGIIELPSAGYLPVVASSVVSVNAQVRHLLGIGVELRFCIVRPDFVAHALEEAQHMERISLLQGLNDLKNKPKVDILVPNGEIIEQKQLSPGRGFEATVDLNTALISPPRAAGLLALATTDQTVVQFHGVARIDKLPSGGGAAYLGAEFVFTTGFTRAVGAVDLGAQSTADIPLRDAPFFATIDRANLAAAQVRNPRAGTWISLLCERNVFELKSGDFANINARGIVAANTVTNTPLLDVELNGSLEITHGTATAGNVQSLRGQIKNAQLSFLGQSFSNPGTRNTILVDLAATVTLTGGSAIEIVLNHQQIQLKLSASWGKQPLEVNAAIAFLSNPVEGPSAEFVLVTSALKENAAVLTAANASHIRALEALDIVAAALRDVTFAAAKARLLFPPPPPLTDDIVVSGTLDWVLFHRRRDKQCSAVTEVPQLKPPQTYRVFNINAPNFDSALSIGNGLDPAALATFVEGQSAVQPVVIKYVGDSAQPLFDFPIADSQWKLFHPGNIIAYVLYGAKDNDNDVLQTNRLRQFESAISDDSKENESSALKPLVPLPIGAQPPDADGIMLFITIFEVRKALLVYSSLDGLTHIPSTQVPSSKMEFRANVPQGEALMDFVHGLGPSHGVVSVTVAVTKLRLDGGASVRLTAVIDALKKDGRPAPRDGRRNVAVLTPLDRAALARIQQTLNEFDEVIYFDLNAGA